MPSTQSFAVKVGGEFCISRVADFALLSGRALNQAFGEVLTEPQGSKRDANSGRPVGSSRPQEGGPAGPESSESPDCSWSMGRSKSMNETEKASGKG